MVRSIKIDELCLNNLASVLERAIKLVVESKKLIADNK